MEKGIKLTKFPQGWADSWINGGRYPEETWNSGAYAWGIGNQLFSKYYYFVGRLA